MVNPTHPYENEKNQLEGYRVELLDLVVAEANNYPWSLTEESVEAYFASSEAFDFEDSEISADDFFSCLEDCWQSLDNSTLQKSLRERFGHLIPQEWYQAIASQAQKIINEELAGIEQLIKCVQPLLTNWGEDDLQTFARPFAYATRSNQKVSSQEIDWDNLSEVKKARLTMEIAHFALSQLKNN